MARSKHKVIKNYIYRLRRSRAYSQKTLAMLVGVRSTTAISDYEQGRRLPTVTTLALLETVLGAKLSEMYPDWYRRLGLQAVSREDRLPPRYGRHIRGRVLGKD